MVQLVLGTSCSRVNEREIVADDIYSVGLLINYVLAEGVLFLNREEKFYNS